MIIWISDLHYLLWYITRCRDTNKQTKIGSVFACTHRIYWWTNFFVFFFFISRSIHPNRVYSLKSNSAEREWDRMSDLRIVIPCFDQRKFITEERERQNERCSKKETNSKWNETSPAKNSSVSIHTTHNYYTDTHDDIRNSKDAHTPHASRNICSSIYSYWKVTTVAVIAVVSWYIDCASGLTVCVLCTCI